MKIFGTLLAALLLAPSAFAGLSVPFIDVGHNNAVVRTQLLGSKGIPSLATTEGLTLYTFDADSPGHSACFNECLTVWPPYSVADSQPVLAPFGTILGNNGQLQLTLNGMPLYRYQSDTNPGDDFGNYPGWQSVEVLTQ